MKKRQSLTAQQYSHRSHRSAILSVLFSSFSSLMLLLAFICGPFLSLAFPCLRHEASPGRNLIGLIGLTVIFLPLVLAITLSFVAKRPVLTHGNLVLGARLLGLLLLTLSLLLSPLWLLSLHWFDHPLCS